MFTKPIDTALCWCNVGTTNQHNEKVSTMNSKIYPTREAYARELWESFDPQTRAEILDEYETTEADAEFFGYFTHNMDSRHNGAVHFTAVEGGYTVEDETDPDFAWGE